MTFITNFNALFVTTKKNMIKFHIIIIMKRIVCVRLCLCVESASCTGHTLETQVSEIVTLHTAMQKSTNDRPTKIM